MRNTCAPKVRIDPLCDRIRLCSPNSGTDDNLVMGAEWNCLTHRCRDPSPWAGTSEPPPTPDVPQFWALATATTAPRCSPSLVCGHDRSERLGSPSGEQDEDRAPARNLRSSASKLDNGSLRHETDTPPNNDRPPPRRPTRTVGRSTGSPSPVPALHASLAMPSATSRLCPWPTASAACFVRTSPPSTPTFPSPRPCRWPPPSGRSSTTKSAAASSLASAP